MACYVEPLINYGWKLGPSCHLIADTEEELHAMAVKIGMKRSWFQHGGRNEGMPHYDLVASKRRLAVANGTIEITRNELGERVAKYLTFISAKK